MREMELQVSVSDALPRPRLAVEFNSWVIMDYAIFFVILNWRLIWKIHLKSFTPSPGRV